MGYFVLLAALGGYPWAQAAPPQGKMRNPPPPAVVYVRPKIVLRPGQACAIPLLNVLPKDWRGDDKMVKRVPPPPSPSADVVAPPAPSCDDVR